MRIRFLLAKRSILVVFAVLFGISTLLLLWSVGNFEGDGGAMYMMFGGGGGVAATPSASKEPSVQEQVHHPRPMTPEELLEAREKNKKDHERQVSPTPKPQRKRSFMVPSQVPVSDYIDQAVNVDLLVPEHNNECWHTANSPDLYADNYGRVCISPDNDGCCTQRLQPACDGCLESSDGGKCCLHYEHCVACCIEAIEQGPSGYRPCKEACRINSAALDHIGSREYKQRQRHCYSSRRMTVYGHARRMLQYYLDWVLPHSRPSERFEYAKPSPSPVPKDTPRVIKLRIA